MDWKKINSIVSYNTTPALGNISGKNPIMALAVDKNSKPYKGIARIITKRKGSVVL
jgi:hypothetical protein